MILNAAISTTYYPLHLITIQLYLKVGWVDEG